MKAVVLGVQAIKAGDVDVVAGGMESMSRAPFFLNEMRIGKKMGDARVADSVIHDGLWDPFYDAHMGTLCEHTSKKFKITRQERTFLPGKATRGH